LCLGNGEIPLSIVLKRTGRQKITLSDCRTTPCPAIRYFTSALKLSLILRRLGLLIFFRLFLFFLRHMMTDCATCCGTGNTMMMSNMTCHTADCGAFKTSFGVSL
jgi:hypothetical protein